MRQTSIKQQSIYPCLQIVNVGLHRLDLRLHGYQLGQLEHHAELGLQDYSQCEVSRIQRLLQQLEHHRLEALRHLTEARDKRRRRVRDLQNQLRVRRHMRFERNGQIHEEWDQLGIRYHQCNILI